MDKGDFNIDCILQELIEAEALDSQVKYMGTSMHVFRLVHSVLLFLHSSKYLALILVIVANDITRCCEEHPRMAAKAFAYW